VEGEEEEKTDNGPQGGEKDLDIRESFIAMLTFLDITLSLG